MYDGGGFVCVVFDDGRDGRAPTLLLHRVAVALVNIVESEAFGAARLGRLPIGTQYVLLGLGRGQNRGHAVHAINVFDVLQVLLREAT